MRESALQFLACPKCKQDLDIAQVDLVRGEHIYEGTLLCRVCFSSFRVLRGVPRLVPDFVDKHDIANGSTYSEYFSEVVPNGPLGDERLYGSNVESEVNDFISKLRVENWHVLRDLTVLDAGCGIARIEGFLAKACKDVVAFDITPAVEQAYEAWESTQNVHIVQGTLSHIPVHSSRFDLVWCDGALPYVSDFSASVAELLRASSKEGLVFSWSYDLAISWPEQLGRVIHHSALPIRSRRRLIKVLLLVLLGIGSIIKRKRLLTYLNSATDTVLDYSLSGKVNHFSKSYIETLLLRLAADKPFEIRQRGNIVDFWVGTIGNHEKIKEMNI